MKYSQATYFSCLISILANAARESGVLYLEVRMWGQYHHRPSDRSAAPRPVFLSYIR